MREILHVGKIVGAHGLKGEVKILPYTDDIARFKQLEECLLVSEDEKNRTPAQAEGARFFQDLVLLKLCGIDDRTAAEGLRGLLISVKRELAIPLAPDTWFVCDLVGCQVFDEQYGLLGEIRDVLQYGASDIYVVAQSGQADLLIPVLKQVLKKVDLDQHRVDVCLPEGLFEIYRELT